MKTAIEIELTVERQNYGQDEKVSTPMLIVYKPHENYLAIKVGMFGPDAVTLELNPCEMDMVVKLLQTLYNQNPGPDVHVAMAEQAMPVSDFAMGAEEPSRMSASEVARRRDRG